MKLNLMGLSVGAAVTVVAFGACNNISAPNDECLVQAGTFATVLELKEGYDPGLACAKLQVDQVGLEKFYNRDPEGPDSLALRSARLAGLLTALQIRTDVSPTFEANAVGTFEADAPGADSFCSVPRTSTAGLQAPELPAGSPDGGFQPDGGPPAQAAQNITYEWSDVRIVSTEFIPGTQFVADLKVTENGCTAEYRAKGIWPVVRCSAPDGGINPANCDPRPNPAASNPLRGSGINPSFPVECHPVAKICVLTGEVPSETP